MAHIVQLRRKAVSGHSIFRSNVPRVFLINLFELCNKARVVSPRKVKDIYLVALRNALTVLKIYSVRCVNYRFLVPSVSLEIAFSIPDSNLTIPSLLGKDLSLSIWILKAF